MPNKSLTCESGLLKYSLSKLDMVARNSKKYCSCSEKPQVVFSVSQLHVFVFEIRQLKDRGKIST